MDERPRLRSVGKGPAPPSATFRLLCTEYPDLPRRVVGEVLARAYREAWSLPDRSPSLGQTETASRALLDAIRVGSAETIHRTGRTAAVARALDVVGPRPAGAADLRSALESARDRHGPSTVGRLAAAIHARARSAGVPSGLNLLCEVAAEYLALAAVAVSVPGRLLSAGIIGAAGALARPLEERQVILGEGPSADGLRFGTAVRVDDLTNTQQQARWPIYAPSAAADGVRAQYVFPMKVGAAHFGVFVLYLDDRGGLWPSEMADARVFAELAMEWLVEDTAGPAAGTATRGSAPSLDDRAEIHQATGMVAVQLGVDLSTALVRLRAQAFAQDESLSEIALAVVARTLRFHPDEINGGSSPEESL